MQETRRAVLSALGEGPITGPELADRLDVSRAAVWKHVEELRSEGFDIDAGPAGYSLVGTPEYGGIAVEYGLEAPFEIEFHHEIDSTNRRARELAMAGAGDIAVVAAAQSSGRGRLDRDWASPPGGVYLSVVVRPDLPLAHAPVFTMAAAVAVVRTAREAGVDARIKWPNDVLVPRADDRARKLAGVLTEMEGEADRVAWLVVGVGINVSQGEDRLVDGSTSLGLEGGSVERRLIAQRFLKEFHQLRLTPNEVLPEWRDRSLTLGRQVRVESSDGVVEGEAKEVAFPGSLLVDTGEEIVTVAAGDCEHLRPTE